MSLIFESSETGGIIVTRKRIILNDRNTSLTPRTPPHARVAPSSPTRYAGGGGRMTSCSLVTSAAQCSPSGPPAAFSQSEAII